MTASVSFLEVREITKRFPGVLALDRVSLHLNRGEVLAVVGENGAGKSTLMKILAGVYQADDGTIKIAGDCVQISDVATAIQQGISLIHQELNLAENLSVIDNLFLGREIVRGSWLGLLDRRRMLPAGRQLLTRVGLNCPPHARVGVLSPGQRQLVEIARALALDVRLLIMDEPTSSLTQVETERLFDVIAGLKRDNVAIMYISHRLAEVQRIADRVVVLRDGRNAGELTRDDFSHDAVVRLMVGRELKQFYQRARKAENTAKSQAALAVHGLRYAEGPTAPASFTVRAGEIVGMAGLVGAGRTELAEALFGIRRATAGSVLIDGRETAIRCPTDAVIAGLLLVPEDRRSQGLVLEESVQHNIGLPSLLKHLSRFRFVKSRLEAMTARYYCDLLKVQKTSIRQAVGLLSGGNQQKIVLAKWLARPQLRVLILDEPTRGIDVGAKSEIYALMDELTQNGVGLLMISSDLEEIIGMSDRLLVLHEGTIAGELSRAEFSEERIMTLATGRPGDYSYRQ